MDWPGSGLTASVLVETYPEKGFEELNKLPPQAPLFCKTPLVQLLHGSFWCETFNGIWKDES